MSCTKKKRKKPRKPRNIVVLGMILTRKAGRIKDRREARKGAKNRHRELMAEASD